MWLCWMPVTEAGTLAHHIMDAQEKNDNLNLALAVGNILEQKGIPVIYTRTSDVYQTPFEKAEMANRSDADFFVSFHRNAMPVPGTASGIESLVYENTGAAAVLARNINEELKGAGFADLGVIERPGLVVLKRTRMPAVLVEAGFIDNEADNRLFDQNFTAIAQAIADGIQKALEEEEAMKPEYYQIQTGAYRNQELATQQLTQLKSQGFPAFLVYEDGLYKVRVGAFLNLDHAVAMEKKLREYGYSTVMVKKGSGVITRILCQLRDPCNPHINVGNLIPGAEIHHTCLGQPENGLEFSTRRRQLQDRRSHQRRLLGLQCRQKRWHPTAPAAAALCLRRNQESDHNLARRQECRRSALQC